MTNEPARTSRLVVALDGPGSSGKSTVGAEAARRLRYRFCDTGLLYRAVTWLALRRGIPADSPSALVPLAEEVHLVPDRRGRLRHVEVDGVDVTSEVRSPLVDRSVSEYSKVAELRAALVPRQRAIASAGGIIVAGRDIGTVILPDADLKIYLDASAEERARRRTEQRKLGAASQEAVRILDELRRRDAIDSGRRVAPLRIAADAIVLHTDGNTFNATVSAVVRTVRDAEAKARAIESGGLPESAMADEPNAAGLERDGTSAAALERDLQPAPEPASARSTGGPDRESTGGR